MECCHDMPCIDPSEVVGDLGMADPVAPEQLLRDIDVETLVDRLHAGAELRGTRHVLSALLRRPLTDIEALVKRQACIRTTTMQPRNHGTRHEGREDDALWLLGLLSKDAKDANGRAILESYTRFTSWPLRYLNRRCATVVNILNAYSRYWSPFVGVLTPVIYILLPYIVFCIQTRTWISPVQFVAMMIVVSRMASMNVYQRWVKSVSLAFSVAVYAHGTVNSFRVAATTRSMTRSYRERMQSAFAFLGSSDLSLDRSLDLSPWVPWAPAPAAKTMEANYAFNEKDSIGTWVGREIALPASAVRDTLRYAYIQDAIRAIAAFQRDHGCLASYVADARHPCLRATAMGCPTLPADKNGVQTGVTNDLALSNTESRNIILTGPNAGGKSTLMRAVLTNALLAQTCGVAMASSFELTPFATIVSGMHKTDTLGSESLFEAELNRSLAVVETLYQTTNKTKTITKTKGGHALVVMDELFSSTNPVEGIAAAAACAARITRHPRCVSIISTHFTPLCGITAKLGKSVSNYHMPIVLTSASATSMRFPYKLVPGISDQYVAIELINRTADKGKLDSMRRIIARDALTIKNAIVNAKDGPVDTTSN